MIYLCFLFIKKTLSEDEIREFFENYNINKLDIDRMFRLINNLIDITNELDINNDIDDL